MQIEARDIFSVPNGVSAAGLLLAIDGARKLDTWAGIAETIGGRALDVADGWLARLLEQSSDLGGVIDASFDKAAVAAIVTSEWIKDIAPKPVLAAIVSQNVANAVFTGRAVKAHPEVSYRPSVAGKRSMFLINGVLIAYPIGKALEPEHPKAAKYIRRTASAAAVGALGLGLTATYTYFKRSR